MNLGWFGVPPSGGSNGLDRLKPGLHAVRGSWNPEIRMANSPLTLLSIVQLSNFGFLSSFL
jgi:hypothetical protein